jgi:hypothetical protein
MENHAYRQRLEALREENECLRRAAYSFGELAERLAQQVRELRSQAERANAQRGSSAWASTSSTSADRREVARRR